jgi:hypothetical protein
MDQGSVANWIQALDGVLKKPLQAAVHERPPHRHFRQSRPGRFQDFEIKMEARGLYQIKGEKKDCPNSCVCNTNRFVCLYRCVRNRTLSSFLANRHPAVFRHIFFQRQPWELPIPSCWVGQICRGLLLTVRARVLKVPCFQRSVVRCNR